MWNTLFLSHEIDQSSQHPGFKREAYFLCPISKVRYDYTDHFVSSIPQAMIFFDFFGVFLVGFRWGGVSSRTSQHVRASEKKSVGPQMAVFRPFSRGKKVPENKTQKKVGKKYFFTPPRHHSGSLPDSPRP